MRIRVRVTALVEWSPWARRASEFVCSYQSRTQSNIPNPSWGLKDHLDSARLLSFFSMSDIHITDKESPAQVPCFGWNGPFGGGGLYVSAYSPIMLTTTHVLDAAVKTVNALHHQAPFNFGIVLGDVCNSSQFNELRWFIDVMDGKHITPSSGAHLGADTIDYQKPYQAAGLDRSIPWYEAIGNHDQFWVGI